MIGKVIAAVAGAKVAERSGKLGSTGGALLGLGASLLVRRLRFSTILALAAGGYAAKKLGEMQREPSTTETLELGPLEPAAANAPAS